MAPKKSQKDRVSKDNGGKKKKTKSGLDGQKLKKTTKGTSRKNAWGKDKNKGRDDGGGDAKGVRRGLRPVRIKLDQEGRDAILDIMHKLHVSGARDDAVDDDDDDDHDDKEDNGDDDEEDDDEDSDIDDDCDVNLEFDGTFAKMANLLSDVELNDEAIPVETPPSGAAQVKSAQNVVKRENEKRGNDQIGGGSSRGHSSSPKGILRSNTAREKLLASMVKEDRKVSRDEDRNKGAVPAAAIAAASVVGGGSVEAAARGYQRPDPPVPGTGNDKVRLAVCGEKKKTGAPDLNTKKMIVFDRKESIQKVIETCRGKLKIKKKASGAALLEGEEVEKARDKVVDWLSDLSWVPNDAVVFISCTALGSQQVNDRHRSSASTNASAGTSDAHVDNSRPSSGGGGGGEEGEAAPADDQEGEEEVLALEALTRIRESYRARARVREVEVKRRGAERDSPEELGKRLLEKKRRVEGTVPFREMASQRQKLPAFLQREEVVNTIRTNQVVVLSGETGCGKTTQVPQFVLDSMIDQGKGGECNIVCTQPRRISAVGVAERVAAERCERVGDTVGYQIRLESRVGPSTRLTFCTTGILLRRMTSDDTLAGVSHIMVDEVHERDLQTDFLLVILRDLLPKRPDLSVVLMSATLQADLFTKYFHGCPVISIPGRTFPVEVTYIDEVNRLVRGSKIPAVMPRVSSGGGPAAAAAAGRGRDESHGRGTGGHQGAVPVRQGKTNEEESEDNVSSMYDQLTGEPLTNLDGDGREEAEENGVPASVRAMISPKCQDKIDKDIMVDLVDYILTTEAGKTGIPPGGGGRGGSRSRNNRSRDRGREAVNDEPLGAILVFLPGFFEIDQLVKALERHPRIGRAARIFPLHSSLPSHQQRAIFQRMPPGVRKIVVSTNIAETSVTIDDCTHVIDAGRVREMRYDPITRMSCLVEVWISKASGSQRAGRAGRVRPGKCWRLYPEAFYENFMPPHTLAEMLRTPLEELVLQVLLLELGSPAEFLTKAVEPPPPKMLRAALRNLYDLQAIVIAKNIPILTPLGYHLAHLPVDARVGKLLLFAAILQCLDPILTIAAALSDKAPFQRPFGEQAKADAARERFAQHKSDHLAIVEAFAAWRNKRRTASYSELRIWCRENFLSQPTLERLDGLREQFRQQLSEAGFASSALPSSRAPGRDVAAMRGQREQSSSAEAWGEDRTCASQDPDKNSGNIPLVQSVLCAGLYPHVAAFMRPDPQREIKKGFFVTRDDPEPVFMHPSSVNHRRFAGAAGTGRQVWVMYHSKMKTKQVYLYDSTFATPFSLLLWGARVRHERPLGHTKKSSIEVIIDRWLRFHMKESTAVVFKAMRRELSNLLVRKIEAPLADTGPLSSMLVACLARLLDIEARI